MDRYVTGTAIRRLREKKRMTQEALADKLHVTSKAVSKWETGHGFPDISLLEPLAEALGISVIELLSGEDIQNRNPSANMVKVRFYVCPVCGNVIQSVGETVVSCCGITLPLLEAEAADENHAIKLEVIEDEYFASMTHPMTKDHYISFMATVSDQGTDFRKLYPEGNGETRFKVAGATKLYAYCNRHGLFQIKLKGARIGSI